MSDPGGISVELQYKLPIALSDLAASHAALADEYKRFAEQHPLPDVGSDPRLYVQEIRPGSIITELQPLVPLALPFWENRDQILSFLEHLKKAYDFLLGKNQQKPALQKSNYENLGGIVQPVAKDDGAQINIGTLNINSPVQFAFGNFDAIQIQKAVKRELEALRRCSTMVREKVLLYWYQARNDPKSNTGDKAVIESITLSPVKVVFVSEGIKGKLLMATENIFKMVYVVDVAVETVEGQPTLYRILEMHDHFERPATMGKRRSRRQS